MQKYLTAGLIVVLVLLGGIVSAQDDDVIRQWATSATASSEYASNEWSAMQATGEPDVVGCGDSRSAWASLEADGVETLTLYYDEPVQVRQINIHINYNPGTITSVAILSPDGSPVEIPDSTYTDTTCPTVFSLVVDPDFASDLYSNGVQITIDQSEINNWTEIDAVEIIGMPLSDGASSGNSATDNTDTATNAVAVPDGPLGEQIYCDGNLLSENGVVFTVVQMRPNSNYTATVVGVDGFDPVLSVRDAASGDGICNDDNRDASYYEANLPTAQAAPSNRTASMTFNTFNYSNMANIELVVGGFNSQPGEFVLILEGMLLSQADGAGDPLAITISSGMMLSGVNPTVYMFSVVRSVDPLIAMIDSDYNFLADNDGNTIMCDDAGNASNCWGESYDLRNAFVSRSEGRSVSGTRTDAMLTMPISPEVIGAAYIPIMRSYEMRTFGDYVAVFHVGIGAQD